MNDKRKIWIEKMIVMLILLLSGFSLYGESSCEKLFADAKLFQDANELDDTDRYLGYVGDLLDRKIIGETHLKKVLEGLKNGELINPISENEVVSSSSKMKHMGIHRDGLQEYLDEDNLDPKRVEDFVTRNLKEEKRVRVKRNEIREETKGIFEKMNFIYITPGIVKMGEYRRFEVEIKEPFEIMVTPITQYMWVDVMGYNPSNFKDGPDSISMNINGRFIRMQTDNPVERVSFLDTQEFIKKLNVRNDGYIYRLPTEAEWEYVARNKGQVSKKYHFGSDKSKLSEYAWFDKNSNSTTHPICKLKPLVIDGKEIFDLHGNVWEWVSDWYGKYPNRKRNDYKGPNSGSRHVLRGGCWFTSFNGCRVYHRLRCSPGYSDSGVGLRLVRVKK